MREYWYIGSTSAKLATTKYITEPRVATGLYFSRAVEMLSSVFSASRRRVEMTPEVTYTKKVSINSKITTFFQTEIDTIAGKTLHARDREGLINAPYLGFVECVN